MNEKPNKLWTLRYNGDIVLIGVPYPVLQAKKRDMKNQGCYEHLFSVEFHKDISRLTLKK